jgi:hypothetical protein
MRALIPLLIVSISQLQVFAAAGDARVTRTPVASVKPLLLTAIDTGAAYGELTGKPSDVTRQIFETNAPIVIDVKRIAAHRQPGCARLEVTTSQAGVVLPAKKGAKPPAPKDMTVRYQIDYCRNGEFPAGEQ